MIGTNLSDLNRSDQFNFVQFHPNYDYSDFVEGLKPVVKAKGEVGFELKPGVFQEFCYQAQARGQRENEPSFLSLIKQAENLQRKEVEAKKAQGKIEAATNKQAKEQAEISAKQSNLELMQLTEKLRRRLQAEWKRLISELKAANNQLKITHKLTVTGKETVDGSLAISFSEVHPNHIFTFQTFMTHLIRNAEQIKNKKKTLKGNDHHINLNLLLNYLLKEENKKYVFVIDEINRGDLANIFGELFYSIDPGYRGKQGAVKTQYASMRTNDNVKGFLDLFYVPENVYLIGTMNDIDRSVETFDFAMRRRFRFIEVTAKSQVNIIQEHPRFARSEKARAVNCLLKLNEAIDTHTELNSNYHIGPAYFLNLVALNYNYTILWSDYLEALLEEYLRGFSTERDLAERLHLLKSVYDEASRHDA